MPVDGEPVRQTYPANADKPGQDEQPPAGPGSPWDQWLQKWYSGKGHPKWIDKATEPLGKMLAAEDPEEKMAAALTLAALGKIDLALPVIEQLARTNPEQVGSATQVFPWLVWEKRLQLFERLRKGDSAESGVDVPQLIKAMTQIADRRAADKFWELLAGEELTEELSAALYMGLNASYFGRRNYSGDDVSPSQRKAVLRAAKPRVLAGSDLQRITSLTLMASASPDETAEIAAQLAADTKLSDDLRTVAFKIRMVTLTKKEGILAAIETLKSENDSWRTIAMNYLVNGPAALRYIGSGYSLPLDLDYFDRSHTSGTPIIPKLPRGLKAEHVRPLIDDPDPIIAAHAGYLLALCGEREGLAPLLRRWRTLKERQWSEDRLVVRAIASLDDSTNISALRKIYEGMNYYEMDDFYWTIRIMSGPEILKFRKQIRDEVGMERLQ